MSGSRRLERKARKNEDCHNACEQRAQNGASSTFFDKRTTKQNVGEKKKPTQAPRSHDCDGRQGQRAARMASVCELFTARSYGKPRSIRFKWTWTPLPPASCATAMSRVTSSRHAQFKRRATRASLNFHLAHLKVNKLRTESGNLFLRHTRRTTCTNGSAKRGGSAPQNDPQNIIFTA